MPATRHVILWSALAALAAALGACASSNERDTIGATESLEALDGTTAVRVQHVQSSPLTTMDRSGWEARRFRLPVDGVAHQPTGRFVSLPAAGANSWRDRAERPTAMSALDVDGSPGFERWNMTLAPLGAGLELAATPIGLVVAPPWQATQTPAPVRREDSER